MATFASVSASLWNVGSDITLASMGPDPRCAGPDAMPRKESLGRRSEVTGFGMGGRGWRGATSLLERAGVGFVEVDMWWAGRVMGLTALLVVGRESFEKERSWFVDIVCGLNDRKVKLKWEAETVMGERSRREDEVALWRVCIFETSGICESPEKAMAGRAEFTMLMRKNNLQALVE